MEQGINKRWMTRVLSGNQETNKDEKGEMNQENENYFK